MSCTGMHIPVSGRPIVRPGPFATGLAGNDVARGMIPFDARP
jgi:hypothetical protein